MAEPEIRYDEPSDTLYILFAPGESATGLELSDHILLRVDRRRRRAVGLTLLDFSIITQQTEIGPRSFPLSGLIRLSPELRDLAIELLQSQPVSDYLSLSAFTAPGKETVPISQLRPEKITSLAA
ncbi:MAG TPA: DUF2283 domain-containing protein [Longimicrobiaceae bacterium]|nr:DUF2283 domain-containing protein [Longimicrobiaceae bacterium]